MPIAPKHFVIDVDGVMTDGKFYYTQDGKAMKAFGPDDHDALKILRGFLPVTFVSSDKRGFNISKARITDDMNLPLEFVSATDRIEWIRERWDPKSVIYMGDGFFDHYVFRGVGYAIATANADEYSKQFANYVTYRAGGDRGVAEACVHILEHFFSPFERGAPKIPESMSSMIPNEIVRSRS